MVRSFGALHASYDKRVVGEGHEVRLAEAGCCVWLQSIKNRLGARGRDAGIIKMKRRGVDGDTNGAQSEQTRHSDALNPKTTEGTSLTLVAS